MSDDTFIEHFFQTEEKHNKNNLLNSFNSTLEKPQPTSFNNLCDASDSQKLTILESELKSLIKKNTKEKDYNTYFKDTFFLNKMEEGKLIFKVPSQFIQSILEDQPFIGIIKKSVEAILGKYYSIEIFIKEKNKIKNIKDSKFILDIDSNNDDEKEKTTTSENLKIRKEKTFENFVVGSSNNFAYNVSKAIAQNLGKKNKYSLFYLYSDSGLGKTHLLHAISNFILLNNSQKNIQFLTGKEFLTEYTKQFQNKSFSPFAEKYINNTDIFLLDNFHELENKPKTQKEFSYIIEQLLDKGKQVIITSNNSPYSMNGIENEIKKKLSCALILDIQNLILK